METEVALPRSEPWMRAASAKSPKIYHNYQNKAICEVNRKVTGGTSKDFLEFTQIPQFSNENNVVLPKLIRMKLTTSNYRS